MSITRIEQLDNEIRNLNVCQNNLACAHFEKEEYEESIRLTQEAIKTRQRLNKLTAEDIEAIDVYIQNLASSHNNLASKHFEKEEYEDAIRLAQSAIATQQQVSKLTDQGIKNLDTYFRNLAAIQNNSGIEEPSPHEKIRLYSESIVTQLHCINFTDNNKNDFMLTIHNLSESLSGLMHWLIKDTDQEKNLLGRIALEFKSQLPFRIARCNWQTLDFIFIRLFKFFRTTSYDEYAAQLCLAIFIETDNPVMNKDEKALLDSAANKLSKLPSSQQKCVNELTKIKKTQKLENYRQAYLWQNEAVRFLAMNPYLFDLNKNIYILIALYIVDEYKYNNIERLFDIIGFKNEKRNPKHLQFIGNFSPFTEWRENKNHNMEEVELLDIKTFRDYRCLR